MMFSFIPIPIFVSIGLFVINHLGKNLQIIVQ